MNEPATVLAQARIPEHSPELMRALSNGEPLLIGPWLFYTAADWLMCVAYPLAEDEPPFAEALAEATRLTKARSFFAIGASLPPQYNISEEDRYYVLPVAGSVKRRLLNQCAAAEKRLTVAVSSQFDAPRARLWNEFLRREGAKMSPRVRELYLRAPRAIETGALTCLDALDENGALTATMLLDTRPANFVSYVLGAHSTDNYVPHAADLLFLKTRELAASLGKKFIHLGLGVNPGVLRFKLKWGARPALPYRYAEWSAKEQGVARQFLVAVAGSRPAPVVRANAGCKPYAMLWKVSKGDAVSWLGGTAHFFCYSFEYSFRKLFKKVDNVIFEGPLDADFMNSAAKAGQSPPPDYRPLIDSLTEEEIARVEKMVYGPRSPFLKLLNMTREPRIDVREILRGHLPWSAFFTLWTSYLERAGWTCSVDMEAWRLAREMNLNVVAMENLEEQLESLQSLPRERVLRFLRACDRWPALARRNRRAYLRGDLELMMGSSAEIPTRTEYVIDRRDERFRQRMRPWLEKGRSIVFVGTAHLVNLRRMLAEDGFVVKQEPCGVLPRIHLKWRSLTRPDEQTTWQISRK